MDRAATGDPAFEAASLRVASLLAAEAEDISLAMEICAKMEQRFEINVLPQKVELLHEASAHTRTPAKQKRSHRRLPHRRLCAPSLQTITRAQRTCAELANNSAHRCERFITRPNRPAFLSDEIARCRDAYERISNDWKVFREKPTDPRAASPWENFFASSKTIGQMACPCSLAAVMKP